MCAVPAQVAGVEEIVLCVPPGPDGRVDDATLAAAAVAGVDEVYRVGGAQAIAAMAYGTESIDPVDVIVGPGNRYVAEAKRQVSGVVGVASAFAGPSEVVVIAGPDTPRRAGRHRPGRPGRARARRSGLAAHLVRGGGRGGHRPGRPSWSSSSPRRADLEATLDAGGYVVMVDGAEQACAVANIVAPEHLEILTDDAESLLPLITSAGAVVPRAELTGQRGRLPGRSQPRAAHQPDGPVRQCPAGGRLPAAHPRRDRHATRPSRSSGRTW